MAAVIHSWRVCSMPLSSVSVRRPFFGSGPSRLMIAAAVRLPSRPQTRTSLTSRVLRSTSEYSPTELRLDTMLSPSQ